MSGPVQVGTVWAVETQQPFFSTKLPDIQCNFFQWNQLD